MKKIGIFLIAVGFLVGAVTTVLDEQNVHWSLFPPALLVGVIGIVSVRLSARRRAREEGRLTSNIQNSEASLERIVENMKQLNSVKGSLDPYAVRHQVDQLFPDFIDTFVQARESLAHVYGLQAYADVMSYFAAGERYLNRAWSASADGYVDEVHAYLDKAQEQFSEALQKLAELKQRQT
jgi:hypothetical protein